MSNCNDDYEQIRKKLSECNRDVKYIFVQGLAGPTEPQGDAGIQGLQGEIGTTGPRVEKGDVGPAGPRGFPGETGSSELTLYNALCFGSFPETTVSGSAMIGAKKIVPNNNQYFIVKDTKNISIQSLEFMK